MFKIIKWQVSLAVAAAVFGFATAAQAQGTIKVVQLSTNDIPNDPFSGAEVLAFGSPVSGRNNLFATAQAGEPDHAGQPAKRSLWWKITVPEGVTRLRFEVNGDHPLNVGIYTGPSVDHLTEIASGQDDGDDAGATDNDYAAWAAAF